MNAIQTASKLAGGCNKLAASLNISPPTVSQWINGVRQVPAARCPDIERLTGVRCEELRPDVAWEVLRNSPKLAEQAASQEVSHG